ncbi:unnamed protein product [Clonostachys byssicola]|uniref:Zn(2)-C6 fungal-type domain-containing protein n=1 Tax=Clonostachys byssicola TaxID=160290 RepID=A0A9N9Y5T8_9HYPO|nr:unnamed protein product [Clonostachys byssicola]
MASANSSRSDPRRPASMDDSGYSQPSFKRQRTALACNSCRNRKSRCNGTRPQCAMCVEMGLDCVYQQPGYRRKEVSDGHEARLTSIEQTLQLLLEENRQRNRQQAASGVAEFSSIDSQCGTYATSQAQEGDAAAASHYGNSVANIPEDDTVDGMGAIKFADEQESGFFGPSSTVAFIKQIAGAVAAASSVASGPGPEDHILPSESRVNGELLRVSRPASPVTNPQVFPGASDIVDVYVLPPEAETLHLVSLFFRDTGMLFPYIHEQSALDGVKAVKRGGFGAARRSWLCLLNMILAFVTCISTQPNQPVEQSAADSNVYFKRAQKLSGNLTFKNVNIEIVQYLLLMTQYLQGTQRSAQTWNVHGLTVKAALQLGLHVENASSGFNAVEREVRKRTWYGCIILDRTMSMTFGRPPAIPTQYVRMELPVSADLGSLISGDGFQPEDGGGTSTAAFFVATITLYQILGDIIASQYDQNIGTSTHTSLSCLLENTIRLEGQLLAWKRVLPDTLSRRPWDVKSGDSGADAVFDKLSVILKLRYLNIRTLLHRPVLARYLEQLRVHGPDQNEMLWMQRFGQSYLEACIESASEIITIAHNLSDTPSTLGAWWFSTYYTFNAALIIFSALLIHASDKSWLSQSDIRTADLCASLQLAAQALRKLGNGARLSRRCCKFLAVLVRTTAVTGLMSPPPQDSWSNIFGSDESESQLNGLMNMSTASTFDLSPFGLSTAEFLNQDNLDFFTVLAGSPPNQIDVPNPI